MSAQERRAMRVISADGRVLTKQELEDLMRTESEELVGRMATEVWRLRKRLRRLANDEAIRPITDSLDRIVDVLQQYEVQTQEHDGDRYNDGLQVEVLAGFEVGAPLVIDETVEPSIRWKGRVIRRGKVTLKKASSDKSND